MTFPRSLLFVPGTRPERFVKAEASGADVVCIDLEDAVPPGEKAATRTAVIAHLANLGAGAARYGLRSNAVQSANGVRDLAAILEAGIRPAFLMLPKADPAALAVAFQATEGQIPLWPLVETAQALRDVWEICAAPGVGGVLFGAIDMAADLRCELAWEPLLAARSAVVAACARAGVEALDAPSPDIDDLEGLALTSRKSAAMGFAGRACIHPRQVPLANEAYSPTPEAVARARRIVEAFDAAGGAAASLDGKLIELPIALAARRTLERASVGDRPGRGD